MKGCTVHSCPKKMKLHSTVVFGVDVTKIHPPQNWENVYLLSPSCPRYVHYKSRPLMRTIKRTDNQKKTVLRCCKYSGKQWWQVKFRHRRQPRLICRMSFLESRVKHEICFHLVCWENPGQNDFCQNKPLYQSHRLSLKTNKFWNTTLKNIMVY